MQSCLLMVYCHTRSINMSLKFLCYPKWCGHFAPQVVEIACCGNSVMQSSHRNVLGDQVAPPGVFHVSTRTLCSKFYLGYFVFSSFSELFVCSCVVWKQVHWGKLLFRLNFFWACLVKQEIHLSPPLRCWAVIKSALVSHDYGFDVK